MATSVIDALVITLDLDASDYQKKRKEVSAGLKHTREDADKTAKEMEALGKRAAGFFSSIKNELLALTGVSLSVAGVTTFARDMTSGLQQLSVQSQALGMSARQLDGWSKAALAAGSSVEKITGTLGNFQNAIQAYRNGDASGSFVNALAMLNGDTGVTFDPMTQDPDSLMRTVARAIKRERSGDRARYLARMLGIDDATLQAMRSGRFTRDADRYGRQSGISAADVNNARRFNREWTSLQQNLERTGYTVYSSLSPYIEQFTGYLNRLADWLSTHPKEIRASVASLFGSIAEIARVCDDAVQAVGGWKNALLVLVGGSVLGKAVALTRGLSLALGPAGLIGTLLALETVVKRFEDSNPALKNNPVADFLNNPPGIETLDRWGKKLHDWLKDTTGINLPRGDGYGQDDKTHGALEALKKGQDEDRREQRHHSEGSRGQRDKTNDLLGRILAFFVPSASAGTLGPNLTGAAPPSPQAIGDRGKSLLDSLSNLFADTETQYGLPPGLLRSVAEVESRGNARAVSPAGARGLFQFMPATARDVGLRGNDVFDPQKSARAAGRYLRQLLDQTGGSIESALAAYNWGIGNVQRKGLGRAPVETRQYVPKVLSGIRPGAGMTVARPPPASRPVAQGAPQYHIGTVTVHSPASRVDQLTEDIVRSAQNRARVMGFDTRKTS